MFGVGDTVDKYLLTDVLGTGGMGTVFAAENQLIGKKVAIKILRSELVEREDTLQRFLQEARFAAAIEHPGIVDVLDFGYDERQKKRAPYLVMELLRGESLAEVLERRPHGLDLALAVEVAEQVLGVLVAVHNKKIIHRDLKPENIFLARELDGMQRVKILDFGICKMMTERDGGLTLTGTVLGTPYFMSPEQARGAKDIDHRVDLWAMGAILYEMLTGRVPFSGDSYNEILAKILSRDFTRPRVLKPEIPEWLEFVILKAMTWDRDARYRSAGDFLGDLKAREEQARATDSFDFAPVSSAPSITLTDAGQGVDPGVDPAGDGETLLDPAREERESDEVAATVQASSEPVPMPAYPSATPTQGGYSPTRLTPPTGTPGGAAAGGGVPATVHETPASGHPVGAQTVDSLEPVVRAGEPVTKSSGSKVLLFALAACVVVIAGIGTGLAVMLGGGAEDSAAPAVESVPLATPPVVAPAPPVSAPAAPDTPPALPAKAPATKNAADGVPPARALTEAEVAEGVAALAAKATPCLSQTGAPTAVKVAATVQADGSTTYRGADPDPTSAVAGCLRQAVEAGRFRAAGASREVTFSLRAPRRKASGTRRTKSRRVNERAKRRKHNPFGS